MKQFYKYHARGFSNEFIVIYAETTDEKKKAAQYERHCTEYGTNAQFYRIPAKQAYKYNCENIRDRLPCLFE